MEMEMEMESYACALHTSESLVSSQSLSLGGRR
jgi:hypothetical protein